MSRPGIFLDRDGVINRNRSDYVKCWAEFEFLPGSLAALRSLADLGWPIVVISNQSAIGRGIIDATVVDDIHARMLAEVSCAGARVDRIFYCPHRPEDGCQCRKPAPGMLLRAADELDLDLGQSVMIGDSEGDVLAAQAAGCQPVLVKTGLGGEHLARLGASGLGNFRVAESLSDAAVWVRDHVVKRAGSATA